MQSIDPNLQSAVWGRVMGTAPETEGETAITAEELLNWMQGEKDGCAAYRYLACKARGKDAEALRQMAADEACHFKKLHTMYYLLTGQCVAIQANRPDCTACLSQSLRSAYQGERQDQLRYQKAAERWPAMADEFYAISADEDRHSRRIRSMICSRL